MKLLLSQGTLGRTVQWTQRALFVCAILLLGYCGFALADSWVFQRRENRELDQLRGELVANRGTSLRSFNGSAKGLIGRISIPRLSVSVVVVEGIGRTALRRGIGHIPGTALPGQTGNIGLAGHRDAFFRPLKDLRVNDEIQISTPGGDFRYEVESLRIVDPHDTSVLAASSENVLTLVTCYPFYYVGPAPKRWIVRARQVFSPAKPARSAVE